MSDDLDDFDFDDFDLPDFDSDGINPPKDDRKPIARISKGVLEGVGAELTNRSTQKKLIDSALPKGYGKAFDELDKTVAFGKDLYDTVKDELEPAKQNFKKLGRLGTNKLRGILPDGIINKLDELTKEEVTDSQGEYDPVATEINETLTGIFEAQSEEAQKQRIEDEALESAKFKTNIDVLNAIRVGVNRQVAYQDKVMAQVQRKSLELQYKQYFLSKQQLEIITAFAKESKNQGDLIVKNTALPDFVKMQSSEAVKEMLRQKTIGSVLGTVGEYTSSFMDKFKENIKKQVTELAKGVTSGINQAADAADMMEGVPTDPLEMGGSVAGGFIASSAAGKFGNWLGSKLKGNERITTVGNNLEYLINNKESLIHDGIRNTSNKLQSNNIYLKHGKEPIITNRQLKDGIFINETNGKRIHSIDDITGPVIDEDGDVVISQEEFDDGLLDESSRGNKLTKLINKSKSALGSMLSGAVPTRSDAFNVSKDALTLADEIMPYTQLTDKSITEVIPGLLTEILHETEMIRTNSGDVERRMFNWDTGAVERESFIKATIDGKVAPITLKKDVQEQLSALINTLDPNKELSSEARAALTKQLLRDASDGTKGFDVVRLLSENGLGTIEDETIRESIQNFLVDKFLDETGKLDVNSVKGSALRLKASNEFNKVKNTLPDYQTQLKKLSNLYGKRLVHESGYVSRMGEGDISSTLDKFLDGYDAGGKNVDGGPTGGPSFNPFTPYNPINPPDLTNNAKYIKDLNMFIPTEMPRAEAPVETEVKKTTKSNKRRNRKKKEKDKLQATVTKKTTPVVNDSFDPTADISTMSDAEAAAWLDQLEDMESGNDAPSFDGGGITHSGPRRDGVDGKGGFWALLHPNEAVIDLENPTGFLNKAKNVINQRKIDRQLKDMESDDSTKTSVDNIKERIFDAFKTISDTTRSVKDNAVARVSNTVDNVSNYKKENIDTLTKEDITDSLEVSMDKINSLISNKLSNIKNYFSGDDIYTGYQRDIVDTAPPKSKYSNTIKSLFKRTKGRLSNVKDNAVDRVSNTVDSVSNYKKENIDTLTKEDITDSLESIMSDLKSSVDSRIESLKESGSSIRNNDRVKAFETRVGKDLMRLIGEDDDDIESNTIKSLFKRTKGRLEQAKSMTSTKVAELNSNKEMTSTVTNFFKSLMDKSGKLKDNIVNSTKSSISNKSLDGSGDSIIDKLEELRSDVVTAIEKSTFVQVQGVGPAFGYNGFSGFGNMPDLSKLKDYATNAKDGLFSRLLGAKKKAIEFKDLYVKGNAFPALEAAKLKAGMYIDKGTGNVITTYDDIRGEVVDRYGNVVLNIQDIMDGLVDVEGNPAKFIKGLQKRVTTIKEDMLNLMSGGSNVFKGVKNRITSILGGAGEFTGILKNRTVDIYKKGMSEPLMTMKDIEAGKYVDKLTGKVITSFDDIKGEVVDRYGNVIISVDDWKNNLLVDRLGGKISVNWSGIRSTIGSAYKTTTGTISSVLNFHRNILGNTLEYVSNKYNEILDIYLEGEDKPRLRSVIMKNGGYLSKATGKPIMSIDDIDGEVIDLQGNTVLNSEDLDKDMFTSRGKKLRSISSKLKNLASMGGKVIGYGLGKLKDAGKWGLRALGNLKSGIASAIKGKISIGGTDEAQLEYLDKIYALLDERLEIPEGMAHDHTGDGIADNSWRDRLNRKKKDNEESKVSKTEDKDNRKNRNNNDDSEGGGIIDSLKSLLGIGGVGAAGGALAKVKTVGAGIAKGAGVLAKGAGMLGKASLFVAKGAVTLVGAPVLLGAAAVAAIGIGGYLAYKHLYKTPKGHIHRVRLTQYGVSPDDKDKLTRLSALDNKLWGHVQFVNNVAELDNSMSDEELYEFFGVNVDDDVAVDRFNTWFTNRYKPIFLRHASVLNTLSPNTDILDADKELDDSIKIQYLNAIKFSSNGESPYTEFTTPFDDGLMLLGVSDINNEIANAINKLMKGGKTESIKLDPAVESKLQSISPNVTISTTENITTNNKQTDMSKSISDVKTAVDSSSDTEFKQTNLILVPKPFSGKVSPLMAIRMMSYGLNTLDKSKVSTLLLLEKEVLNDVYVRSRVAALKVNQLNLFNRFAGVFGLDVSNETHKLNWLGWFENRFVPTLISYCNALLTLGITDLSSNPTNISDNDAMIVGRLTYQTYNSNGTSIWLIKTSPFDGYVLNSELSSVFKYLNGYKEDNEELESTEVVAKEKANESIVRKPKLTVVDNSVTRDEEDYVNSVKDTAVMESQRKAAKKNESLRMTQIESILSRSYDVQVEIRDAVLTMLDEQRKNANNRTSNKNDSNDGYLSNDILLNMVSSKDKEDKTTIVPNMSMGR